MVERSVCPHCSFRNFRVSKFCSRCERPLQEAADKTVVSAPLGQPLRPQASPAERAFARSRRTTAPNQPAASPRPVPRPAPPAAPPPAPASVRQPSLAAARAAPAAPTAPLGSIGHRAAVHPVPEGPRPPSGPASDSAFDRARPQARPSQPRPLPQAPAFRHALAYAIDCSLLLLVAAAWSGFEMLVKGGTWPTDQGMWLADLAVWLHAYANTARRSVLLAVVFGAVHATYGVRTGYTVGRRCAKLLLVGLGNGQPTKGATWGAAAWHAIGSTLSLLTLGAGHFWLVVDARHRTWGNVLGKTMLVSNARRPVTGAKTEARHGAVR